MKKVLCFGNPYMKEDSLGVELGREIEMEDYEFVVCNYSDELLKYEDYRELIIMDVVKGIDEVKLIKDVNQLKTSKSVSLHDLDLGFFLKVMQAMGSLDKVRIIGLPFGVEKGVVKEQVLKVLKEI